MSRARVVFSVLLIALLLLPLLSVVSVRASTGHPKLAVVDSKTAPTDLTYASYNLSLSAGEELVSEVDGAAPPYANNYFTIVFAENESWFVVFSGSQFDLYISKDGYSAISTDDVMYAGPFYVADLSGPLKKVHITNTNLKGGEADFYIGEVTVGTTTYKVLIGPIAFDITAEYKFIKIFDGTATSVAVSEQYIVVLPSIELTPTEGPPGGQVTLTGVALLPNEVVNITYTAPSDVAEPDVAAVAQVVTDSKGRFSHTWNIVDLKREFTGSDAPIPADTIEITVKYNETGNLVGTAYYDEYRRAFVQVWSKKYGEKVEVSAAGNGYGNNTITVHAYIHDELVVAGAYWNPTGPVSFTVDGVSMGSATCNATGFFNVTFTVPELTMGSHTVEAVNKDVRYVFTLVVVPTLEIVPEEGPVGTLVTCYAYGFPEGVTYLYWYEKAYGEGVWYNVVNGTVGPDGRFNVTVQFTVPHAYGGPHDIQAMDTWSGAEATSLAGTVISSAVFTVTPKLWIEPPVFSNNGSLVKAVGNGFDPTTAYTPNIDNVYFGANNDYDWTTPVWANDTGDIVIYFVAAGFRPGLHVFSLYPEAYEPPYEPVFATFTVTTEGDVIASQLSGLSDYIMTNLEALNASITDNFEALMNTVTSGFADLNASMYEQFAELATLVSEGFSSLSELVSSGFSTVEEDLGALSDKVDEVLAAVQSLNLTTVVNKLDQVLDMLGDLTEDVSDLSAAVSAGFENVMDELDALSDALTGLSTQLSMAETNILNAIGDVSSAVADLSDNMEAGFEDVMTALDDLNAAVAGLSDDLASVSADLKLSIGDLKSTLTGAVSSAESSIKSSVDDAVSTLTDAINGVKSAVDGVSSAVSSVSSKVDTLSSDLADFRKTAEASSKDLSTYVLASAVLVIIVLILSAITLAKVYKK